MLLLASKAALASSSNSSCTMVEMFLLPGFLPAGLPECPGCQDLRLGYFLLFIALYLIITKAVIYLCCSMSLCGAFRGDLRGFIGRDEYRVVFPFAPVISGTFWSFSLYLELVKRVCHM